MDLIKRIYQKYFRSKYEETPFIVFVVLLLTFSGSRLTTYVFPGLHLFINGFHIHHFYFGVCLIIVSSWISLLKHEYEWHRLSAIIYGAGLGLVLDEVGLMLTCATSTLECDYHARVTFDIIMIVSLIFLNIIYFAPFWKAIIKPMLTPRLTFIKFVKRLFK